MLNITEANGKLCINGQIINTSKASLKVNGKLSASIISYSSGALLCTYTFYNLYRFIDDLQLNIRWNDFYDFTFDLSMIYEEEMPVLGGSIQLNLNIKQWRFDWPLEELINRFEEDFSDYIGQQKKEKRLHWWSLDNIDDWRGEESICIILDYSIFEFPNTPIKASIDSIIFPIQEYMEKLERGISAFMSSIRDDSLIIPFTFPSAIKAPCEQYLIYFVQFLQDLGIEAEADLKHEAHQVLFSVKPRDGAQALEQIREALNVYLNLPAAPDFEAVAAQEKDIAVIQLNAQVSHLKSQIMLAQATLQAKDAAIEYLQLTNFQLKEDLAQSRQIAKLECVSTQSEKKPGDNETILGGFAEITPIESKRLGLKINMPEIVRHIKRLNRHPE